MDSIIGIKTEQSQRFLENGKRIPVTKVTIRDNHVVALKTSEKHGYSAMQIGMGQKKHPTKAQMGHAKKANLEFTPRTLKEVRLTENAAEDLVGTVVALETVFAAGDSVQVTGISKGKGFAGVVKRYHFRGGPRTHGQSNRERHPGSIGAGTTPGRVYKGKRMAGHKGVDQVTIKNMTVVEVNAQEKTMLIDGLLPGSVNSIVLVKRIGTDKHYVPLQKSAEQLAKEAEVAEKQAQEEAAEAERVAAEQAKAQEDASASSAQEAAKAQEEVVEPTVEVAPVEETVEETKAEDVVEEPKQEEEQDGDK
jgi:large subunit ribosomal protein L3